MWWRYVARQVAISAATICKILYLCLRNVASRRRVPPSGPVVISLATTGARMRTVYLAIESVLRGQLVPVTLWLEEADYHWPWPSTLRRLVDRGVRIRCHLSGCGPHTKYFEQFNEAAGSDRSVITIDDDMVYPRWFVEKLLDAYAEHPGDVHAYRAHRIVLCDNRVAPYRRWREVRGRNACVSNFATGVSGVFYPPEVISYIAAQGLAFQSCAPHADDIWLNLCILRSGHCVRQVFHRPMSFNVVPTTQFRALSHTNCAGGNDHQIAASYQEDDIAVLAAAAPSARV